MKARVTSSDDVPLQLDADGPMSTLGTATNLSSALFGGTAPIVETLLVGAVLPRCRARRSARGCT